MKEKPILFSAAMVRAILEGRKTQTRRVVKLEGFSGDPAYETTDGEIRDVLTLCPHGQPGSHLWVKETHQWCPSCGNVDYAADVNKGNHCRSCDKTLGKWRPSIFMFREDSRITLEIVSVRVERLQDISEEDAKAEGIESSKIDGWWKMYDSASRTVNPLASFRSLWQSINGLGSWTANPWVWVVEFRKVQQ